MTGPESEILAIRPVRIVLSEVMPITTGASDLFKDANNFFDLVEAFSVGEGVILYDGFYFTQRLITLQLYDLLGIQLQIWEDNLYVLL